MLHTCVASTDALLTTTQRLRDYIGASATGDDALQGIIVAAASRAVEDYVGYTLLRQTYEETLPGIGRATLMVSRTPIRHIEGLFYGTDTGTAATEITSTEYVIDSCEGGLLRRVSSVFGWTAQYGGGFVESEPVAGTELRRYLIRYEAGYIFTQASAAQWGSSSTGYGSSSTGPFTLPPSVELAVLQTAKAAWLGRKRDETIQSKSVGDLSINYGSAGQDISVPDVARGLLRPYLRTAV